MDYLKLVVSVIGTVSAVIVLLKWILPRFTATVVSLRKAKGTIQYYFRDWNEAPVDSKNEFIIPYKEFLEVDRHRDRVFVANGHSVQSFLLTCAVVHRLWPKWLKFEYHSQTVISSLATLLNGRAGWRPVWRSAYLLQGFSDQYGYDWIQLLPSGLLRDEAAAFALQQIKNRTVISYLEGISEGHNSHLRDKAFEILEDLRSHHGESPQLRYPEPTDT